ALSREPLTTCGEATLLRGSSAFVAAAEVPPSATNSASSARWCRRTYRRTDLPNSTPLTSDTRILARDYCCVNTEFRARRAQRERRRGWSGADVSAGLHPPARAPRSHAIVAVRCRDELGIRFDVTQGNEPAMRQR